MILWIVVFFVTLSIIEGFGFSVIFHLGGQSPCAGVQVCHALHQLDLYVHRNAPSLTE